MARNENPPFPRGTTYFGGDTTIIETVNSANLEGQEYVFEDLDLSTGTQGAETARTNRPVKVRIVRNVSGGALLPKRTAALLTTGTAAQNQGQVSGYSGAQGKGFPIDEWLPAAGVANNDLFYIVVDGPATVTTAASGTTTIAAAGIAVSAANGLMVAQDTTTTGANLFAQIENAIGRAITGVAANSTDFVIDVFAR